jgi:hypothetical protein
MLEFVLTLCGLISGATFDYVQKPMPKPLPPPEPPPE